MALPIPGCIFRLPRGCTCLIFPVVFEIFALLFNPAEKPVMDEYDLKKRGGGRGMEQQTVPVSGASTEPYRAEKTLILKTPSQGYRLMGISEGAHAQFF